MKVVDMSWNLDSGVLRFWNSSARIHEVFEDLFESTFDLRLVRDAPYVVAANAGLGKGELEALLTKDPTPFHSRGNFDVALDDVEPGEDE